MATLFATCCLRRYFFFAAAMTYAMPLRHDYFSQCRALLMPQPRLRLFRYAQRRCCAPCCHADDADGLRQ